MPKITLIGAGSAVFSKNVIADILWHPALRDAEFALVDIDRERLDLAYQMALSINWTLCANATITATQDRREALVGSDFVINTIGVGGHDAARIDLEIPLQHGLKQVVGDTLGVGGIFRSARSIPEVLAICRDMEELCPKALLMNYTNPMAMHMLAIQRTSSIRAVGLCHGVVYTARTMRMLVALKDRSPEEINQHFLKPYNSPERTAEWLEWHTLGEDPGLSYTCAGINHMAAFLRFESNGEDLYPKLREALDLPHLMQFDAVRFELFRWLGFYMTETSGHCSEYLPYFLKSDKEIERCSLPVAGYLRTLGSLKSDTDRLREMLHTGSPIVQADYSLSVEYASRIINAITTDTPFIFNGNIHNAGGALISNLPGDSCVEVPCVASRAGILGTSVGDLPRQVAALIRTNINVQDLAVQGILENNKDYLYQAAMLDPNTASSLTLPEIRAVMDALFEAHQEALSANLRFGGKLHFGK